MALWSKLIPELLSTVSGKVAASDDDDDEEDEEDDEADGIKRNVHTVCRQL